jgi:hypothetical protein
MARRLKVTHFLLLFVSTHLGFLFIFSITTMGFHSSKLERLNVVLEFSYSIFWIWVKENDFLVEEDEGPERENK